MAMNLRLRPDAEEALRAEAARTGRSQQDILREAVDEHLGLVPAQSVADRDPLLASGKVLPPRVPYRRVVPSIELPEGTTSLDLLKREDRF